MIQNIRNFALFLIMYLLCGLSINFNQQNRLILSWHGHYDTNDYFEKNFKDIFRNTIRKKMSEFAQGLPVDKIQSRYEERLILNKSQSDSREVVKPPNCQIPETPKDVSHNSPWYIQQFNQTRDVNYEYLTVRRYNDSGNENFKITKSECKVFSNFIEMIENRVNKNEDIKSFDDYSNKIKQYFLDNKIPGLKPYLIYVATTEDNIATYPSFSQVIPIDSYKKRPWGKSSLGLFPTNFLDEHQALGNSNFGLTHSYRTNPDSQTDEKSNTVRTAWYKFRDDKEDKSYILCIDFFFDPPDLELDFLNWNYLNFKNYFLSKVFLIYIFVPSLLFSLLSTFLCWRYQEQLSQIILKIFNITPYSFSRLEIELELKYIADNGGQSALEVESIITSSQEHKTEQAIEAGWNFYVFNTQLSGVNNHVTSRQNEKITTYKYSKIYNLKIQNINSDKNLEFKRIETWKAKLIDTNNKIKEIGSFVVEWRINRSADNDRDLNVTSIHWDEEYQEYQKSVTKQLFDRLLMSEKESFNAVLDSNYEITKKPIVPKSLMWKIPEINNSINYNLCLQKRKVTFENYNSLVESYFLGKAKALCCISFLEKLNNKQKIDHLLKDSIEGKIYLVENQENEFRDFFSSLNNDSQLIIRKQSILKIIVFRENADIFIKPQDNFCIIEVDNDYSCVVSALTDDSENNCGWISWRKVDIDFYTKLYDIQINSDQKVQDVDNYLRA